MDNAGRGRGGGGGGRRPRAAPPPSRSSRLRRRWSAEPEPSSPDAVWLSLSTQSSVATQHSVTIVWALAS
ncbi:hypothetical protein MJT46_017716 [Ovis ammon polii x Ovis aries]|nr:hypothetical protein MJT46_017716 [Ovis ammon polii x Ovis aries]